MTKMKILPHLPLGIILFSIACTSSAGQCDALKSSGTQLAAGVLKEAGRSGSRPASCFAAYLPKGEDVFRLGFFVDGALSQTLPPAYTEGGKPTAELRDTKDLEILAVSFPDLDRNGAPDLLVYGINSYKYEYHFVHVYWTCPGGFVFDRGASDAVLMRTLNKQGLPRSSIRPADMEKIARSMRFKDKCTDGREATK